MVVSRRNLNVSLSGGHDGPLDALQVGIPALLPFGPHSSYIFRVGCVVLDYVFHTFTIAMPSMEECIDTRRH